MVQGLSTKPRGGIFKSSITVIKEILKNTKIDNKKILIYAMEICYFK
jgi:hypothetical protein